MLKNHSCLNLFHLFPKFKIAHFLHKTEGCLCVLFDKKDAWVLFPSNKGRFEWQDPVFNNALFYYFHAECFLTHLQRTTLPSEIRMSSPLQPPSIRKAQVMKQRGKLLSLYGPWFSFLKHHFGNGLFSSRIFFYFSTSCTGGSRNCLRVQF